MQNLLLDKPDTDTKWCLIRNVLSLWRYSLNIKMKVYVMVTWSICSSAQLTQCHRCHDDRCFIQTFPNTLWVLRWINNWDLLKDRFFPSWGYCKIYDSTNRIPSQNGCLIWLVSILREDTGLILQSSYWNTRSGLTNQIPSQKWGLLIFNDT